MKELKILGTGCSKCQKLAESTEAAAIAMGLEHRIEKITQLQQIMCYGVMVTPALVVDGVVKVAGRVPSVDELKRMIGN